MTKLKPCPCGAIPAELHITEGPTLTFAFASGSCCNDWFVEFRTDRHTPHSPESMVRATQVWNAETNRK